ncbi:hypothetical protein [Paenibacillus sp. L3-i20]|uniref:hypothetical protein n=1 Tax=Paenibacillus sp. L3-i20 TaxID=2905833 RepID=UPI001EE079D5|nr:hypothetical protein [Paenibacillus sp. L3-i20]
MSMLIGSVEGLAIFGLTLYIFRFDLKEYLLPSLLFILLMGLQVHFIYETEYGLFIPLLILFFLMIFMFGVTKLPFVGAVFTSIVGYGIYMLIQLIVVMFMFGGLEAASESESNRALGQVVSGIVGIGLGKLLYTFGFGFTKEYDKFKFKWEKWIVLAVAIGFTIFLIEIVYLRNIDLAVIFLIISLAVFLYYAIKKEQEDDH